MNAAATPPSQPDVQSLVIHSLILVSPTTVVQDAIAAMAEMGTSCVLVVENHGRQSGAGHLIGILTEGDLARVITQSKPSDQLPIRAVMSQPVITLHADRLPDLNTLLKLFQDHGIHHLPVLDDGNHIVGLLTQDALTTTLAQNTLQLETINRELQQKLTDLQVAEKHLRQQTVRVLTNFRQTKVTPQNREDHQHLGQGQSRLLTILEASTDYISMADATGKIIWHNTALKQVCGWQQDGATQHRRIADYHPPWAMEIIWQEGLPTAIAKGSWVGEIALLNAEGQEIPVSQLILAHKSPQGAVEYVSTIARDMRVHKEYEQQLERSNAELIHATRLKDEFLATITHELRTPLNAILGMSEMLEEEAFGSLNERQKSATSTVKTQGRHLLEVITDILEVSKITAGKLTLSIAPVSVTHLCLSSLTAVKQDVLKKQIQLNTIFPPDLGDIVVDERRIRQVLIHLLGNAVKFSPIGGRVTLEVSFEPIEINLAERVTLYRPVSPSAIPKKSAHTHCQPQDSYLCISVRDTGIGIATADQTKIFQPFMQLDSSLSRHYEGAGLGLMLVKQIVELHEGSVSLQSELGQGSCFTVKLPCASVIARRAIHDAASPCASAGKKRVTHDAAILSSPPQSVESPEAIAVPPPAAMTLQLAPNPLILLVANQEANIITISNYLTARHYQILVACHNQEVMELLRDHHPSLIVIDIPVPEMDGLEAIRQIRNDSQWDATPIITLVSQTMPHDCQQCLLNAGANRSLAKPVRLKELANLMQILLPLK